MRDFDALPAWPIGARGPLSRACLERELGSLPRLGRHLRDLPYGRGRDRADYGSVLAAGRGTCSSKHAFLAATAAELGAPLELLLGLYEMSEANTPGVGAVLATSGLTALPEAHCIVRWGGVEIDLTRGGPTPREPIAFLEREVIGPDQIGEYKVAWHRERLRAWCQERRVDGQQAWEIRERCIAALAAPGGAAEALP